jgi:SWI/SNF-related matrix-associated actin-dependent regulator of chromatin subfamily D
MYLDHFPDQYKVLPELGAYFFQVRRSTPYFLVLASVLGIKEESRIGVIQTLWNYIKLQGLQDKVDRRLIRADDKLRPVCYSPLSRLFANTNRFNQIFGAETVIFQKLPEIVNRYLVAPDPIILHYSLNPGAPPPDRPSAWDVEIKMEDSALKHRMAVTVTASKESAQTLVKLDEEVRINIYFVIDNLLNHDLSPRYPYWLNRCTIPT